MDHFVQLDLTRLAKRLVSEDGLCDEAFAHIAIDEYKKFFFLLTECEEGSGAIFLPSPIVDMVWQRHMLDTLNYFSDCATFDMPNGYCHRHELRSPTEVGNEESSETKEDVMITSFAREQYRFTVLAYEQMYSSKPPPEFWPEEFDQSSLLEKRTIGNDKYLSYAIPHSSLATARGLRAGTSEYELPNEADLTHKLMWVGELVFDTLPLKQLKCVKGEVIGLISFEAQREAAVSKVVREYARFLLLVMRQAKLELMAAQEGRLLEKTAEITPSKLVDELWHAHILCSPAYFAFCVKHAPAGRYLHHFPHFDKPHDYHVPGFSATLALYKEVYDADPADAVWGVLGESGGGGGGCGGGGGGGGGRSAPPPNFSILGAGAGCGIGPYYASCGAGNVPSPGFPGFPMKRTLDLTENGNRKILCDVDILNAGLNKNNLGDAPVWSYVMRAPYTDTYMKRYTFKPPEEKRVPFMGPQYISQKLFEYWQTLVERKLEERFGAARAISLVAPSPIRDKYNIEWKASVHEALDALVDVISPHAKKLGLQVYCIYTRGRAGGTIYFDTDAAFLVEYSPPADFVPPRVPRSVAPNPPFVWPVDEVSPLAVQVFDQHWVCAGLQRVPHTEQERPRRGLLGFSWSPVATSTSVPLCFLRLPFHWEHQPQKIACASVQYNTVSNYTGTFTSTKPVLFMNESFMSTKLYKYLQYKVERVILERKTVAEVLSYLPSSVATPFLEAHWAHATEIVLLRLLGELNAKLAPLRLRLRMGHTSTDDRFVVIECSTLWWMPPSNPGRFAFDDMPPVDTAGMEHQMMLIVGSATEAGADTYIAYVAPVFPSDAPPVAFAGTAAPVAPAAPLSVSRKKPGPSPLAEAVPAWAAPVSQRNEVLSVTVPANYPQCGSELTTRSPTTGQVVKFNIPPGSLPGSQILVSIPR